MLLRLQFPDELLAIVYRALGPDRINQILASLTSNDPSISHDGNEVTSAEDLTSELLDIRPTISGTRPRIASSGSSTGVCQDDVGDGNRQQKLVALNINSSLATSGSFGTHKRCYDGNDNDVLICKKNRGNLTDKLVASCSNHSLLSDCESIDNTQRTSVERQYFSNFSQSLQYRENDCVLSLSDNFETIDFIDDSDGSDSSVLQISENVRPQEHQVLKSGVRGKKQVIQLGHSNSKTHRPAVSVKQYRCVNSDLNSSRLNPSNISCMSSPSSSSSQYSCTEYATF